MAQTATPNGSSIFKSWLGSSTYVDILDNGTATFAGGVNAGSTENRLSEAWGFQVYGGPNSSGFALYNSGLHTTNSAQYVVRCNVGGVGDTVDIRTDGSATFAGNINVNNYATFSRVINDGWGSYFIASFADSGGNKAYIKGNGIFIGNGLGGANDVTPPATAIALRTDGSATFAGAINGTTVGTSDIKFKENIEAAPAQLADIEAFELKTFDWKDEAPISDELKAQRKLGLIAQEVEAICPEMVYEVPGQDDDSYKAINHDVLIMKLLGAVKELSAKVAALEAN